MQAKQIHTKPLNLYPCGFTLSQIGLTQGKRLIFNAADQRQVKKAQLLAPNLKALNSGQQEWLLFSQILKSLGYSNFSVEFERLAESFPLQGLTKQIARKEKIIGQWAKSLGLLSLEQTKIHPDYQEFYSQMQEATKEQGAGKGINIKAIRPANHPWRRLTGLYYHLEATATRGLLKSWLKFFWDAEALLAKRTSLKKLTEELALFFPTPTSEPLANLMVPTSKNYAKRPTSLIGTSKQMVILTNSIMPFFLSWAREYKDKKLEKTLFSLYLILPSEGGNSKTQKMLTRLYGGVKPSYKRGLSFDQGLIQIHDDWCLANGDDCTKCKLPQRIKQL